MNYPVFALLVILAAALISVCLRPSMLAGAATWQTVLVLAVLTMMFDQLLTGLPIVTYRESELLGIQIGWMPLEDLSYAIAVGIVVPTLWKVLHRR